MAKQQQSKIFEVLAKHQAPPAPVEAVAETSAKTPRKTRKNPNGNKKHGKENS